MLYVTSVESIGIRKGHQKVIKEGQQMEARQLLHRSLTRCFGLPPEWAEATLNEAEPATLEHRAERLLFAENLKRYLRKSGRDRGLTWETTYYYGEC